MVENGFIQMIYPKLPDAGDDPSVAYKSLEEKSPIKQNRNSTNGVFIFVFIFFLVAWLAVGIYPSYFIKLIHNDESSTEEDFYLTKFFKQVFHQYIFTIYDILTRSVIVIPSFILFAAGLMFLYTLLLQGVMGKIFVYVAIIFLALMVAVWFLLLMKSTYLIIETLSSGLNPKSEIICVILANIVVAIVQLLYRSTVFHCALKVKVNYVADVMKKSCKAIFHYQCLIIFSSALLVLHLLVLLFTAKVYITLQEFSGTAICHSINIIAGSYLLIFIAYFGQTVIARCIATWHYTMDTEEIPKSVLLKSITTTARYHIGTVAFGSTVILPILTAIYMSFKVKINEAEKSDCAIIRFFTKINLIFKIVDCAVIQAAIRGHNFSQATKRSFDLVLRNSSRYLAVTEAFIFIFNLIMIIVSVITGLIMYSILEPTFDQQQSYIFKQALTMPFIIFCTIFVIVFPYFCLLSTAVKTILLCTFNDALENDESSKKPYLMNVQLHQMLTE